MKKLVLGLLVGALLMISLPAWSTSPTVSRLERRVAQLEDKVQTLCYEVSGPGAHEVC